MADDVKVIRLRARERVIVDFLRPQVFRLMARVNHEEKMDTARLEHSCLTAELMRREGKSEAQASRPVSCRAALCPHCGKAL